MPTLNLKSTGGGLKTRKRGFFNKRFIVKSLICIIFYIIIFAIVMTSVAPKRYDLRVGDIADENIRATKDIVDNITTNRKIQEAVDAVPNIYKSDNQINAEIINDMTNTFEAIDEIRYQVQLKYKEMERQSQISGAQQQPSQQSSEDSQPDTENQRVDSKQDLPDNFIAELFQDFPIRLSTGDMNTIINGTETEITLIKTAVASELEKAIRLGIKTDTIASAKSDIIEALQRIQVSNEVRNLGINIASSLIRPNMIYDEEATLQNKEKAAQEVEKVVYKKGQLIVAEGQPVTIEQIEMLKELGLLKDQDVDVTIYIGVGILVFLLLMVIVFYTRILDRQALSDSKHLILIGLVMTLVLVAVLLFSRINIYLAPISAGAMIITILLRPRIAIVVNALLSILVTIMAGNDINVFLVSLIGGFFAIYMLSKAQQRNSQLLAGVLVSCVNMVVLLSMGLIFTSEISSILTTSLWGLGSGVLASILTIGTLPIWENIFDVITPAKLLELSTPNHPLLKKLLLEASGTYHHSILVGNLAERAIEYIGGDPLLARVGAYYHDVGKLKRPYFFKENQVGSQNPHNKITPNLSTLIITSHTKDGLEYAKKYKIPPVIRDIIIQHHGTSLVAYFYHKAQNGENGNGVDRDNFRYEGPKPQTREAAIIMLADCVEAAVRSISDPTPGKIEGMIRKLIKDKLDDGQLDESELTLKDLNKTAEAFSQVLCGVFHKRIEYPELKK
ncbi:MAG TPA: HDIG domain-containing protein [Clostridiales bacterium]|nr:HDIG domain-containing protein [Clostridiales bacterium]